MNKNAQRFALVAATLLFTGALSAAASATPSRLVLSVEDGYLPADNQSVNSVSIIRVAMDEQCYTLASGASWCVPVLRRGNMTKQADTAGVVKYRSVTVTVPDELSVSEAQSLLQASGLYTYVERDVVVRSNDTWNASTPNDPEFSAQNYFDDSTDNNPIGSSVLSMWRQLQAPQKNIDVYVMDAGFRLHDDITYAPGVNFTVVSYDTERKPGFLESEFNDTCDSSHGVGVAGVIGATINNGLGVAGVAGDVTLHPLRVLDCHMGFLTDVAAAMDWLSGESAWLRQQSPDLPVFTGKPGIINLSLGGPLNECPVYMQNAINKVMSKGFVVVVAAGNEGTDVASSAPANCKGVISVGAADFNPYSPADLAGFSNYGQTLSVMAQGTEVPGLLKDQEIGTWTGTSFSSPLVAGIIAAVSKDFTFTPAQWQILVSISGDNVFSEQSRCATLGCGAGILNASKLYANAVRMQNGDLNQAAYTLSAVSSCRQAWAVANLLPGKALCDQVTVTMDTYGSLAERDVIKLFTTTKDAAVSAQDTSNMMKVGEYRKSRFIVDKAELLSRDVYGQKCNVDTGVCADLSRVSTSELTNVPAVCQ